MEGRRWRAVALTLLLGIAFWQLGHAAWIHVKARLAQHLLRRAWTRTLAGETRVKPWSWADTWPVARLELPAHRVDLIVLEGVSGRTLAFGPGHAPASAVPGEVGTALVTGHRDTHFHFLARVKPGDAVLAQAPGWPQRSYVVREIAVVDARDAVIRTDDAADRLVLLTCYPFDALTPGGPLRYVVVAEAVADRQAKIEKSSAFSVMNSSSTGVPSRVFSMPRLMADTIWPGSVTRSPQPPRARAKSA
jgi:sortase A